MRNLALLLLCALCVAVLTPAALASTAPPPADTLKVDYFSNANSGHPAASFRLTNPGTGGGNIWAAIYVFDPDQELSECCECLLTPDGLRTLSVDADLTANPLTGPPLLTTGLIKAVSTSGTSASMLYPTPALRAWATHIQNSNFDVTETGSQDATLSSAEVTRLNSECASIQKVGSGHGICTCGTGD
jgi:hypothetical protein